MGRVLAVAGLAGTLLIAAGCGTATRERASTAWPSPAEAHWLVRVGAWRAELASSADGFGTSAAAARAYARCSTSLQSAVGTPPSPRLQPAFSDFDRACSILSRLGRTYLRKPSAVVVFDTFTTSAAQALTRSDVLFKRGIRAAELGRNRPLPEKTGLQPSSLSYIDPELAHAVRGIARGSVTVRCWSIRDWTHLNEELHALGAEAHPRDVVGRAYFHEHLIELRHDICGAIAQIRQHHQLHSPAALQAAAEAVKALAHEAFHIRGDSDEAVTECHAMQLVVATALRLRITPTLAHRFGRIVWLDYHLMPANYRTSLCIDGGPFDLHPGSHVWP